VKVKRLLDQMFGRPDPMRTVPNVEPVATRDDDGTITFTAIVPKLDPKSVRIDRQGKGTSLCGESVGFGRGGGSGSPKTSFSIWSCLSPRRHADHAIRRADVDIRLPPPRKQNSS
jgi:hypothetical protein